MNYESIKNIKTNYKILENMRLSTLIPDFIAFDVPMKRNFVSGFSDFLCKTGEFLSNIIHVKEF